MRPRLASSPRTNALTSSISATARASCQADFNRGSATSMPLSRISRARSLTSERSTGTRMPRKRSPSPYSPGPVLKNRCANSPAAASPSDFSCCRRLPGVGLAIGGARRFWCGTPRATRRAGTRGGVALWGIDCLLGGLALFPFFSQFLAGLVIRHAQDQALVTLDQRVGIPHFRFPIFIGERHVLFLVHQKIILRRLPAEDVQPAVDDRPSVVIAAPGNGVGDAVAAEAAELRCIFRRVLAEQGAVFLGGEAVGHALEFALDLRLAQHMFTGGEISRGVVALQHQPLVGGIARGIGGSTPRATRNNEYQQHRCANADRELEPVCNHRRSPVSLFPPAA